MKKSLLFILTLLLILVSACAVQQQQPAQPRQLSEPIMIVPSEIQWKPGPVSLPPGAKFFPIEGNLSAAEPFTFRLQFPANYKIAPHTHPAVEHVTVISGKLFFGAGTKFDKAKAKAFPAGSVMFMPIGEAMFGYTDEETAIQVHGIGPWGLDYINPEDDPRIKK